MSRTSYYTVVTTSDSDMRTCCVCSKTEERAPADLNIYLRLTISLILNIYTYSGRADVSNLHIMRC